MKGGRGRGDGEKAQRRKKKCVGGVMWVDGSGLGRDRGRGKKVRKRQQALSSEFSRGFLLIKISGDK